jgi:hypothetical protein
MAGRADRPLLKKCRKSWGVYEPIANRCKALRFVGFASAGKLVWRSRGDGAGDRALVIGRW